MTKREEGYYWVRFPGEGPKICEYTHPHGQFPEALWECGTHLPLRDLEDVQWLSEKITLSRSTGEDTAEVAGDV